MAALACLPITKNDVATPLEDTDGYLRIAARLGESGRYVGPDDTPTAFRPPLFPIAIALSGAPSDLIVHCLVYPMLLCGVASIAREFSGRPAVRFAIGFLICCPLLLAYLGRAMTELTSAWFAACLVIAAARCRVGMQAAVSGGVLGLAILTRPVFAAFGLLWGVWVLGRWLVTRRAAYRPRLNGAGAFLLGLAVVWSPWVIRNALVFDAFIPFTTHGGYTLLLGNNPVFWDEVARVSPFATWDGESLDRWQKSLEAEMAAEGVTGEVARDAWQRRRAVGHIVERPGDFLRGVGTRVVRFWCPVPLGYEGSAVIYYAVGLYETAFLLLAFAGLAVTVRTRSPDLWVPAVLMIAAFQGVHLFYWANARMRAPLVPVLAVFAAVGLRQAWLVFKPMILKHLGRSAAGDTA